MVFSSPSMPYRIFKTLTMISSHFLSTIPSQNPSLFGMLVHAKSEKIAPKKGSILYPVNAPG